MTILVIATILSPSDTAPSTRHNLPYDSRDSERVIQRRTASTRCYDCMGLLLCRLL